MGEDTRGWNCQRMHELILFLVKGSFSFFLKGTKKDICLHYLLPSFFPTHHFLFLSMRHNFGTLDLGCFCRCRFWEKGETVNVLGAVQLRPLQSGSS